MSACTIYHHSKLVAIPGQVKLLIILLISSIKLHDTKIYFSRYRDLKLNLKGESESMLLGVIVCLNLYRRNGLACDTSYLEDII